MRPLILISLGCALLTGCASPSQTASSAAAVLKSEFIFQSAPFPSCHAATLAETKSGLVAAWFGGTAERNPDVCIYVSRLENPQWTKPVAVADGVGFTTNRQPTWNPVLFQATNGPLLLFYKVGPKPSAWWGMMMSSTDDGKTWSPPVRLPDGILGPIKNKPVQLANGDLLCPSSTEGEDGWRVHFERTSDLGKTWSIAAPATNKVEAIQPSILFHTDGKLQSIGRTKHDKTFSTWSTDSGATWSELTLLDLPNPNSGTDAVTLRDGTQLLVYNHNVRAAPNKGRSPLNVAVSHDGMNWRAALVLEDDVTVTNGFAYPAVIQTRDGLVHIVYTWGRKRIKHVVVDPQQISARDFVNGHWPTP
jgi:predicted neuraminidase